MHSNQMCASFVAVSASLHTGFTVNAQRVETCCRDIRKYSLHRKFRSEPLHCWRMQCSVNPICGCILCQHVHWDCTIGFESNSFRILLSAGYNSLRRSRRRRAPYSAKICRNRTSTALLCICNRLHRKQEVDTTGDSCPVLLRTLTNKSHSFLCLLRVAQLPSWGSVSGSLVL